jgi:hypothetical protein
MGLLQRWLDEPDESIARFAKTFYLLTFLFMAVFALQMVLLVLRPEQVSPIDFVGPCVTTFLTLVMYCLALDGRRSYKAMKTRGGLGQDGAG